MYKVYLLEKLQQDSVTTTNTNGFDVTDLTTYSVSASTSNMAFYNDAPDFEISGIYSDGVSSNVVAGYSTFHGYTLYYHEFFSNVTFYLRFGYRNMPIALIQYRGGKAINTYYTVTYPYIYDVTFTGVRGVFGDIFVITTNVVPAGTSTTKDVTDYIELDTEDIDIQTVFSVSDIADISKRKDNITKTVVFKGTKNNNKAFGHLFHLNKATDLSLGNKLFFNYAPIRQVDCLVYEDSRLILKGNLMVLEVDVDKLNNISYQTVITGSLIDFNAALQNLTLADIDFTDLQHRFTQSNVTGSWNTTLEYYNTTTNSYYNQSFQLGKGYLYPFIDYGATSKDTTATNDFSKIPLQNFRPAIYAKEYVDRIFAATKYTYEIKGSTGFINKFNSLIVPNNVLSFVSTRTGVIQSGTTTAATNQTYNGFIGRWTLNNTELIGYNDYYLATGNNQVFIVNKTFTSDCAITCNVTAFNHPYSTPQRYSIQLIERDYIGNLKSGYNTFDSWKTVVGESQFAVPAGTTYSNNFNFTIGKRTYQKGKQLALWITWYDKPKNNFTFNVSGATISFGKDTNSTIEYEVADGDKVTLSASKSIKQLDFITSLSRLFNLYIYTKKENPKHLIFEKYDDYYALAQPQYLVDALNWTNKIDYGNERRIKANVTIPKSYNFTYKNDIDYFNDYYQKKYGIAYGTFKFNDSLGTTSEKKIELIFSPTPMYETVDGKRLHPAIYGIDGLNKKPITSNIRLLYYNGVRSCNSYSVVKDVLNSSTLLYQATEVWNTATTKFSTYPLVSNYYYDSNLNPIEDLNFSPPYEFYFSASTAYSSVPSSYILNYINQTTELTNPNIVVIECHAYLNEIDINNLDLKVPVFVSMSNMGNAYFKVLSVEYNNNQTSALITLQKIAN